MHDSHGFRFNRKRKADSDDVQDTTTPELVVDTAIFVDHQAGSSTTTTATTTSVHAPRQACLAPGVLWNSTNSRDTAVVQLQSPPAKRARHDNTVLPPPQPQRQQTTRKFPTRASMPRRPPTERYGNDLEDIGTVVRAGESDPGPRSGTLVRRNQKPQPPFSLDTVQDKIPPQLPLVNRQSLKELDFECILRNPQLRHDLLFDTGIQFKPTGSRKKRHLADRYWAAVAVELASGCTCISFDVQGHVHTPTLCACRTLPLPLSEPVHTYTPSLGITTVRTPSRIRPLLHEFLHVLLAVLQPHAGLANGLYPHLKELQAHKDQASHVLAIFDPCLVYQQLRHGVFDPEPLFRAIGLILKQNCAPIRDKAVDDMLSAAGSSETNRPLKIVRQTMDILECMKLDIANHQIQTFQPSLKRWAGHWELKSFRSLQRYASLTVTKEWIWRAHSSLLSRTQRLSHPAYTEGINHRQLNRNQQLFLAALRGLVDIVFTPPVTISPSSLPSPSATPPNQPAVPLPGYPETFYLDNNRLVVLTADTADLTAMYMFLLLYRQLAAPSPVDNAALVRLKNEIRVIGSSHLGHCFLPIDAASSAKADSAAKWHQVKEDIVLQIAMRAKDSKNKASMPSLRSRPSLSALRTASPLPPPSSPFSASPPPSALPSPTSTSSQPFFSTIGPTPDERTLTTAQNWANLHIQPGSPLTTLLRNRLRDAVFDAVVAMTYPGRDGKTMALEGDEFLQTIGCSAGTDATGMEPLSDEIRATAEKISHLARIHLNAYLPLYEHPNFLALLA
ncbi:Tcp11-domain-containing protein [Cylindrobasidium torrendii FP15055 ss-10]|uniref:Tcp11-domain-containing protein n=1 Tax=Cylindrobasidium torrendii FP15055 ss-10 TaxID=1314674 RepID=A0A0D7B303_9AGAR|nr:Tcp11-domain-containing protein [Cylindrobasidium torrendii FP15055 ss-10]